MPQQNITWYLGYDDIGNSYGINAYVKATLLAPGKNLLEVTKNYRTKDGQQISYPISFLFVD